MPFGTIFGAVVFAVVALWSGARMSGAPAGAGRLADVLAALAGLGIAGGLLMRQSWARWAGFAASCVLALLGAFSIAWRGAAGDFVLFLGFAATGVLLAIPATGDARRGLRVGTRPFARAGRAVGWATLVVAALLGVALVARANVPRKPAPVAKGVAPGKKGPAASKMPLDWLDFGPALARAKTSGQPVLVDFYATWCGVCKGMDRQTFRDPQVLRSLGRVVTARVDSEETTDRSGHRGVDLAERYRVEGYPTLVLMDAEGREISRHTGFLSAEQFVAWLERGLRQVAVSPVSGAAMRS
jgi:thioredoxin:protein disulfide reductase